MNKIQLSFFFFFAIFFSSIVSFGQRNLITQNPIAAYEKGLNLFMKEKYNPAQAYFEKIITMNEDKQSEMIVNAEYYYALCAIELFHPNAEYLILKFINTYPENAKIKLATYQLAKLQYRKKKYKDACETYSNVDIYDLTKDELTAYYFEYGYCKFMLADYDNAKNLFYELIETDNKYYAPANYFYAHINYLEKNYETALKSFEKALSNSNFQSLIPYYIIQIYYYQEKYEEAINYAKPILDSSNTVRLDEINRIIGESYFKLGKYSTAIPYFEQYLKKTTQSITREDYYKLGFVYYKSGENYNTAIDYFKKVTEKNDSLSQNTYYLLGDCYLKTNNKKFALLAFQSAYKLSFYDNIKQDALFNFAKLSYELSLNPYNEAISSFQKYLNDYPNASQTDEVRSYLVNIFYTTKNYKDALTFIEKMKVRTDLTDIAYQKIAYYRGIELFNDKKLDNAISLFEKSLTYPFDKTVKVQCFYWKAEALYRLSEFDSALVYYDQFLLSPGAFSLPYYNTANYNMGYCYFKLKEYTSANRSFRKFIVGKSKEKIKIINDAYLRIADCYYVSSDYESAIENYDKAIELNIFDTDYALYQKALCLGVLAKYDEKTATLAGLLKKFPKTAYADDAQFEMANTYLIQNDNENALIHFNKLVQNFPNSSYVKNTLLKKGLIYFNTDQNYQALQTFKKVVADYPATNESRDALVSIRNIYMDIDKVDSFYVYVKSLPFEYGSKTEQDSITYIASEKKYMNGDCDKAIKGFSAYMEQFPQGYFASNAHYYMAECKYKNNQLQDALNDYVFVVNQPKNKFTEYALLKVADVCYDLEKYDSAATYYTLLENDAEYKTHIMLARTMKMRCYVKLGNLEKSIKTARTLIVTEKISEETLAEAHLTIGKAALAMDSIALAQTEFELTSKNSPTSESGAEAKYNLAYINFLLKDYTASEKIIFEIINQIPSYDYWIAKSFILLSDVYIINGNKMQAKATLQSIIDNYDGADLITLAHEKLNVILLSEKAEELKINEATIQKEAENNTAIDPLNNDKNKLEEEKINE